MHRQKVAVVTGAGSGIGRAMALRLADAGYLVWAVGRREGPLKETSELAKNPWFIKPLPLDVGDADDVYAQLGDISADFLILSAGICERSGLDDKNADDVWKRTMSANVDGVWYPFRALFPNFRDNGRAIVVSSGLGKLGREGHGAYVASKHAVLGLVKCFAFELAPIGATVNAICPGWVDTAMSRQNIVDTAASEGVTPELLRADAEEGIPLGRFVTSEECAELMMFLCSEKAAMITGQSYNINGGEF